MRGDVSKFRYEIFFVSQWYGQYQKVFMLRVLWLENFMCDLVNTENYTDKYLNIIEDYETAKTLFTARCIFIREKVR